MKLRTAVFLDRDGVINASVVRSGKPYPPARPEEVEILPGVALALEELRGAGHLLIVVTNQPDVARGAQSREVVDAIHASMQASLPLDAVYCCFHDDADACECRKPAPGMLLRAARELGVDVAASFMVGDRWRDTDAGARAGCRTVFIDRGYDERRPTEFDHACDSLVSAAAWILAQPARTHEGPS
ncbi:MAG: HAD family hydrolase [Kofleriaceae bacterium]